MFLPAWKWSDENITIAIDAETYRGAQVKAAQVNASVSALVQEFLTHLAQGEMVESEFDRLKSL